MIGDRERALKQARNDALDDEATLHRSLHIVRVFLEVWGENEDAHKLITELSNNLIAVRRRARARHQAAERTLIDERDEAEIRAQFR